MENDMNDRILAQMMAELERGAGACGTPAARPA